VTARSTSAGRFALAVFSACLALVVGLPGGGSATAAVPDIGPLPGACVADANPFPAHYSYCLRTSPYASISVSPGLVSVDDKHKELTLTLNLLVPECPTVVAQRVPPCVESIEWAPTPNTYRLLHKDVTFVVQPSPGSFAYYEPFDLIGTGPTSCIQGTPSPSQAPTCTVAIRPNPGVGGLPDAAWLVVMPAIDVVVSKDPNTGIQTKQQVFVEGITRFQKTPPSASITIVKDTPDGADPQAFSFTGDDPIGDFSLDTDPASSTPERSTFDNLTPGTYQVSELVPDGWRLAGLACADPSLDTSTDVASRTASIAVAADESVTCTFSNRKTTSLEIALDVRPAGSTVFSFGGSDPIGPFQLDGDPASALPDRISFDQLSPGKYTVTADVPTGWAIAELTCSDPTGNSTTRPADAVVDADVAVGETVRCLYKLVPMGALIVNSTADSADADGKDGICFTGSSISRGSRQEPECTLRAAIDEANARGGASTVNFDVPGASIPVIVVSEVLAAKSQITIDGTTQPGGGKVELDGGVTDAESACSVSMFDRFHDGLILDGPPSVVRGLVLHSFPGYALTLGGNGGHSVVDSFVGTDATGTVARGNGLVCDSLQPAIGSGRGAGILVVSPSNHIGAAGEGNVISGNQVRHPFEHEPHCQQIVTPAGVSILNASGTVVEGNIIGLDPSGTSFVDVPDFQSSCGLDTQIGVVVKDSTGTRIGGTAAAARNVITAGDVGVLLDGSTGTTIEGNYIGTDATGTVDPAPDLTLAVGVNGGGSGTHITGNVISANGTGLFLDSDVVVEDNLIGVAADGRASLGNTERGVSIYGSGNRLARNTIAYTRTTTETYGQGVEIVGNGSGELPMGNRLTENRIFGNGRLGIDLRVPPESGVTGNDQGFDVDSGPNGYQNFPEIGGATQVSGGVHLNGSLDSAALTTFTVEVFASPDCDDSGNGEGARFLGSFDLTTGPLGDAFIDRTVMSPVTLGERITATATDPNGNTSEFSACRIVSEDIARLASAAPAGSTRLDVPGAPLVGKVVAIGTGQTLETNYGVATGSLILARPTRFAHPAGDPVVARDDTLFVSLDKAAITRSSKLPDLAVLSGHLRAIQGRSVACGDDVTLSLNGSTVAQKLPGTRFTRQSGNHCVFVAKTEGGIGRLELDLTKGTWTAEIVRRDLERLTNPVNVNLTIGNDNGSESLTFRKNGPVWTYAR